MPDQSDDREGNRRFSSLLSLLEILLVIGLFGYPLYGLIMGHLIIPSRIDGGINALEGLGARTMATGMLLLLAGWAAVIRKSEANRKTWNRVGYALMSLGFIGIVTSFFFANPS